ncbi:hypothetical protein ACFY8W_00580 [Streptomyces sp. NPDC012637]|uniref:hypothetical protein n=1 Tax=Streptomyces sp. NPDC012637 TaxID=3364842 RepID=UPI0036E6D0B6
MEKFRVPEDATDRDKAGDAPTVTLVTVDRTVEYREEEPGDGSGVRLSRVTVAEALRPRVPWVERGPVK